MVKYRDSAVGQLDILLNLNSIKARTYINNCDKRQLLSKMMFVYNNALNIQVSLGLIWVQRLNLLTNKVLLKNNTIYLQKIGTEMAYFIIVKYAIIIFT